MNEPNKDIEILKKKIENLHEEMAGHRLVLAAHKGAIDQLFKEKARRWLFFKAHIIPNIIMIITMLSVWFYKEEYGNYILLIHIFICFLMVVHTKLVYKNNQKK